MRCSETSAKVVKTAARPSAFGVSPPSGASRRTMGRVCPAQSVLCARRGSPALMEAIGCVQRSTSAARRVINHRVKKETVELSVPLPSAPPRWRKGRQAYRDPGHPWRPGSASIGSKWKEKRREEEGGREMIPSGLHYDRGEIQWRTQSPPYL